MTEFRVRLLRASAVLAVLLGVYIAGLLFSAERARARAAGASLLPIASAAEITGIDLLSQGRARLALRRQGAGWEVRTGLPAGRGDLPDSPAFPANAGRVETLLSRLISLRRGALVSADPARYAELGLSEDAVRLLLLRRGGGQPEVGLRIGARAPSGDQEYLQVRGESGVYLVRGSLSVLLGQDRAFWYDLRVLPDEVRGTTAASIRVRGSLEAGGAGPMTGYTLVRRPGPTGDEWAMEGEGRPLDRVVTGAMINALTLLEGEDLLEALADPAAYEAAAPDRLEVEVATLEGITYSLRARPAGPPGKALVTTSWSPWTYVVNEIPLRRAVRPASELLAGP